MEKRKIVYLDINEIKPYKNNPRINKNAIEFVKNSIERYGFNQPIGIDKNNTIVVGHTRYEAAKLLELKTVPVVILDDLDKKKVKEYRIADNSTRDKSSWNYELLDLELKELDVDMKQFGLDFDNLNLSTEFSEKNQEINVNDFEDSMKIVLNYTSEEYKIVIEQLKKFGQTPEHAVWKLLGNS